MRISVFGLGYVGCVTATCLASNGHTVVGVDVNPNKVALIQAGCSPINEPGLDELLGKAVASGRLRATQDADVAVQESDVALICVGTPSNQNGCVNLQFIDKVCAEIGRSLARDGATRPAEFPRPLVVVRSTVLPGTVLDRLLPILEEASGLRAGINFGLCMNPEFLREGSAIKDFYHPGCTVIGELDPASGDMLAGLYAEVSGPLVRTSIPSAEMAKYVCNAFHALKITFANEIGTLCKAEGLDGQEVMDIFCHDERLNISRAYLKPGFAFGGSCLPKDVRALVHRAKERDVDTPVLGAILPSNRAQLQRAIEMVESAANMPPGRRHIGILGLSFKPATDDVRESPTISLVETLVGRGYEVAIYDEIVDPDKLIGVNKAFLERALAQVSATHIAAHMRGSLDEILDEAEVVVVANGSASFRDVRQRLRDDQLLIDLVGVARGDAANDGGGAGFGGARQGREDARGDYEGICW